MAPGVLEEAFLAVRAGRPLIVLGGFGGVGGRIADVLFGRLDPADVDAWAEHFVDPIPGPDGRPGPGFAEMLAAFDSFGVFRNGLGEGENRELLETRDPNTAAARIRIAIRRIAEHRTG